MVPTTVTFAYERGSPDSVVTVPDMRTPPCKEMADIMITKKSILEDCNIIRPPFVNFRWMGVPMSVAVMLGMRKGHIGLDLVGRVHFEIVAIVLPIKFDIGMSTAFGRYQGEG